MERTTISEKAASAAAAVTSAPPRRRWSDGPNYAWSPAAEDEWSLTAQWPALVAALCEEVAGGTNDLARDIDRLRAHGKLSRADVDALRRAIVSMRSAGMAMQQIVRLGAGLFNLSPDRVELADLARAAVRDRQRELLRRRVDVGLDLRRAEVWVDGAIASGVMQTGLEWALSFSNKVRLKVMPGEDGEPARVVIRGALPLASEHVRGNRRMNDNLHWALLRQLAGCARLGVGRSSSAATESAVIEFPAAITNGSRLR
jgi:hypothetical protein